MEPIAHSQQSAAHKLREMIRTHIIEVTDNPAVGAAMVFEIKSLMNVSTAGRGNGNKDEFIERRDAFFEKRDYFESLFRDTILNGIENDEFRQVDVPIVTKAMLGAQNWVGVWYRAGGRLDGEGIARIMADTFLTSLTTAHSAGE
jgi:hypothetical protein